MSEAPSRSQKPQVKCAHCGDSHPVTYTHCPSTGQALHTGKALIGRVIADRYKVVGLLGEGGMGAVYVAEHTLIGRKMALKRLHPELAADAKAVARFQREARAAAATGHENIVEILDLGFADDGAPFLVMEYLKGRSLATTLRREGRLAPARACHIIGQVLSALGAVHRQQIVHRDLKPDNIFLTRRSGRPDYVKVLDFGISKMRREGEEPLDLTRTGVMLGTPFYMSPEQARGMKQLDHRVDLYATGVILYECLSGKLPFDGQNYHALLQAILAGTPPRLTDLVPGLDPKLADIVYRAIARRPDDRYATSREMLQALVPFGAVDIGVYDESDPPDSGVDEQGVGFHETTPMSSGQLRDQAARARPSSHPPVSVGAAVVTSDLTPSTGTIDPEDDDEMTQLAARLPRPSEMRSAPQPFVATSADWVGSGRPSEPLSFSTPAAVREAVTPYRPEGTPMPIRSSFPSRPSQPAREPTGRMFTGSEPRRRPGPTTPDPARLTPSFSSDAARNASIPPGEAHVKGTLLLSAVEHLEQTHGRELLDRVMGNLPTEVRSRLRGVVLPVAWFPIDTYERLLQSAEELLDAGDGTAALEIGAATAARDLPTTHRLFMQSATPAMAMARIPQLWRTYHSRGEIEITQVPAGGWRLTTKDFPADTYLHAMAMCGFYQKLLELAGARNVRVALLSSRGRGDDRTITSLRWR